MDRIFRTEIKRDYAFFNDYTVGRISGVMYVICGEENKIGFAIGHTANSAILATECSAEQYMNFKSTIEKLYPGMCNFDVK